jgi:hypothetical protein
MIIRFEPGGIRELSVAGGNVASNLKLHRKFDIHSNIVYYDIF